ISFDTFTSAIPSVCSSLGGTFDITHSDQSPKFFQCKGIASGVGDSTTTISGQTFPVHCGYGAQTGS
ncbi:uncharacterized protein PgNI_12193, partial [Pyricularia grisea]|uniref:Uncharacterized protein n=1 Tax=Pyricularia grisea TaxID=148305 RepID=A0A6P8AQD5_PYRGI